LKLKEVKRIVKAAVPFELAIPIEKDIVGWWLRTVGVQTVFRRVLLLKTTMLPRSGSRRPPDYLTKRAQNIVERSREAIAGLVWSGPVPA
jgi:hypothetical protein